MSFPFFNDKNGKTMMLVLFKESQALKNASILRIYSPKMGQAFLSYR